ncbi:MAG: hypothetical protein OER80_07435 [Gammaproteobacteria bacterium]|nr:hypothetical protein [Gammaproteobacteria bacterium]MDH3767755.1 hypothetical protein [Gammaproteobacteria bacterium]
MPQFDQSSLQLLTEALTRLESGFDNLPDHQSQFDLEPARDALLTTADRLEGQ